MQSVVDRNIVMRRIPVLLHEEFAINWLSVNFLFNLHTEQSTRGGHPTTLVPWP